MSELIAAEDRLAGRLRDAVNAVSRGNVNRYIGLDDIEKVLRLVDHAALQRAARRASALGWVRVVGRDAVQWVAITDEGRALAGGDR